MPRRKLEAWEIAIINNCIGVVNHNKDDWHSAYNLGVATGMCVGTDHVIGYTHGESIKATLIKRPEELNAAE